jgi:hypothetical protein
MILISSVAATFVAYRALRNQRAVARRQATIQMLMHNLWDKDYMKCTYQFSNIASERDRLSDVFHEYVRINDLKQSGAWKNLPAEQKKKGRKTIKEYDVICAALNNYELIAIGIREGIYDEIIYKRWFRTTVINHWSKSRVFMELIRGPIDGPGTNAFHDFDEMARRWHSEGPLKRSHMHFRLWNGNTYTITTSK